MSQAGTPTGTREYESSGRTVGRLNWDRRPKQVHAGVMITVIIMLCYGLVMLFSASMTDGLSQYGSTGYYVSRQIFFTVLGLVGMFVFTRVDVRWFNRMTFMWIVYGLSTLMLVLVMIPGIGVVRGGARRWFEIPGLGMTFQPSEFTKIALVFCLAVYYSWLHKRRNEKKMKRLSGWKGALLDTWWDIYLPFLVAGTNIALVLVQPHASATVILIGMLGICMLAGGIRLRSWLIGGSTLLALLIGVVLLINALAPSLPDSFSNRWQHVGRRISAFVSLNRDEIDPEDGGIIAEIGESASDDDLYQSRQALIAIGSGGTFGQGLGQGRQKYNFLPEGHNDYIFSNIAEELGFVGSAGVLLLFLAFFIQGLSIALRTTTNYAQIIATGYSFLITIQAALSIGVNIAVLPPTGISLPFFSYGGTSNLFFLLSIGLLLNVSKYSMDNKKRSI